MTPIARAVLDIEELSPGGVDAPVHGECAAEIRSLRAQLEAVTRERDALDEGRQAEDREMQRVFAERDAALARAEAAEARREQALEQRDRALDNCRGHVEQFLDLSAQLATSERNAAAMREALLAHRDGRFDALSMTEAVEKQDALALAALSPDAGAGWFSEEEVLDAMAQARFGALSRTDADEAILARIRAARGKKP